MPITAIYLSNLQLTGQHKLSTSRDIDLIFVKIFLLTCLILSRLVRFFFCYLYDINYGKVNPPRDVALERGIYCNKRNRQIQMHQSLAICVRHQSLINKTF